MTLRIAAVFAVLMVGCSHNTAPAPQSEDPKSVEPIELAEDLALPNDDISRGELPWWHRLTAGVYNKGGVIMVLGTGDSSDYEHIAEGYLHAKVSARLSVRRASEVIRFDVAQPEPALEDLFITRKRHVFALYAMRLPRNVSLPANVPSLEPPRVFRAEGRRRVGRHVFEGERHLYLECEVEGPIANPDWGRTRAAARP